MFDWMCLTMCGCVCVGYKLRIIECMCVGDVVYVYVKVQTQRIVLTGYKVVAVT